MAPDGVALVSAVGAAALVGVGVETAPKLHRLLDALCALARGRAGVVARWAHALVVFHLAVKVLVVSAVDA